MNMSNIPLRSKEIRIALYWAEKWVGEGRYGSDTEAATHDAFSYALSLLDRKRSWEINGIYDSIFGSCKSTYANISTTQFIE